MTIAFPPLPYAGDALAPHISADTLATHHGKHHKAYVDKVNAAIEGTDLADKSLEEIIHHAEGSGNKGMFNNAAQSWNHGFYWHSLAPQPARPAGELLRWIETAFGSLEALEKELASRGAGHFSNGWVWLASKGGTLSIEETHDGDTLADTEALPLLTIDLWEHAYYLDYQNVRPNYLEQVIRERLNWDFAAENLARGSAWKYPAMSYAE